MIEITTKSSISVNPIVRWLLIGRVLIQLIIAIYLQLAPTRWGYSEIISFFKGWSRIKWCKNPFSHSSLRALLDKHAIDVNPGTPATRGISVHRFGFAHPADRAV